MQYQTYRMIVQTLFRSDIGSQAQRSATAELKRRYNRSHDKPIPTTTNQFEHLRQWAIGMASQEEASYDDSPMG